MSDPRQLPLPLPHRAALGRADYFVSSSNAAALAMIEAWRTWPEAKLVLTGPPGSGKTHLAHVWAQEAGARVLSARDIAGADLPALTATPLCIEDVPDIAGTGAAENALFHLHNLCHAQGTPLMLTGAGAPTHWPLVLPDLKSRVQAIGVATLPVPDDALLAAVLAKLFADRQIVPSPDVIPYLALHMPRSLDAARDIVDALDRAALTRRSGVTRPLARDILARWTPPHTPLHLQG